MPLISDPFMKTFIIPILSIIHSASAATVVTPYSNPGTDGTPFPYEALATLSAHDSWSTITGVGGWSYVDLDPTKNPNRGWGHASTWYLVEITEATRFELTVRFNPTETMSSYGITEAAAAFSAHPGFVIYAGESVEDRPANLHTYSNNGDDLVPLNDSWDDNAAGGAAGLTHVTHAYSTVGLAVTGSVDLLPGRYTIAIGNGADSSTHPSGKIYDVTFTSVPEPSATGLGALGGLALLRRRRR